MPAEQHRDKTSKYVPSLNEMTPQQKMFADEYLIDLNPAMAAIRAGYPAEKASYAAGQVMKHPPVRTYIAKAMAARSVRVGITADRVLQRLGAIVMGDPRAIFNADGGLKKPGEMNADDALMLAGVKTRRIMVADEHGESHPEEITEIKVVDALGALSLAMKHLGMMNDKLDINVTHSLHDRMAAAQARLAAARGGRVIDADEVIDTLESLEEQSEVMSQQVVAAVRYDPPAVKDAVDLDAAWSNVAPIGFNVEDLW